MYLFQRCGRCKLQHVKVQNRGIDWACEDNIYWKHDVKRKEELRVILHGNAEFEATNVTLQVCQLLKLSKYCFSKLRS